MGEPARDSQSHAESRSHRDVLAPAGENDNDCLLMERAVHNVASHRTGGASDHSMEKFDVNSSAMHHLLDSDFIPIQLAPKWMRMAF